jgi:hypothetical protein
MCEVVPKLEMSIAEQHKKNEFHFVAAEIISGNIHFFFPVRVGWEDDENYLMCMTEINASIW